MNDKNGKAEISTKTMLQGRTLRNLILCPSTFSRLLSSSP